jgi:hypothetical protein
MWVLGLDFRAVGPQSVKAPDRSCELIALLALEEQLCNFFASTLIIRGSHGLLFLFLVLIVNGAEAILWVYLLVLCFRVLSLNFPNVLLL